MKLRNFILGCLLLSCTALSAQRVVDQVNLFIGTANDYGQMSPGATVPFGQVQICPDSDPRQHPGYDYEVTRISGISINRLSGVGGSGCGGNVSIMPDSKGENIHIDKSTEVAVPGYYAARLSNGVQVALTADRHMAVGRYTFPKKGRNTLLLNPLSSFERTHSFAFQVLDSRTIGGYVECRNTCGRGRYHLYYRIYTSQPFEQETLGNSRVRLNFNSDEQTIEVRVVVSSGLASALEQITPELVWNQDFESIRETAANEWNQLLSRFRVDGEGDLQTLFYTSLYRVFHSPFQITDDTFTSYLGTDGQVHQRQDYEYYSSWSLWDTYRTKFAMITLAEPAKSHDMMCSLAQLYMTGKKDWSTDHECALTVRTEHAVATLLDALRKGIVTADELRPAYAGMCDEMERLPQNSPDQALEKASDFWAIGQLAGELGLSADASNWQRRGAALFDATWKAEFQHIDTTYTRMKGSGLYQGTRWQYRWGAPMYLDRMEKLHGRKQLARELVTFFDQNLYNQGNEPDIHVPFLFGRLGMPTKTGHIVHQLMLDSIVHRYGGNAAYPEPFVGHAFRNAPRGYCPEMDEDDGTMSAWFVFSCMGMYPLIIGEPTYELFSPVFDRLTLQLGNGRQATIRTVGRTDRHQTLHRVAWNGKVAA